MQLKELIGDLTLRVVQGDSETTINDICDDSRHIGEHGDRCVFVARSGVGQDGREFIHDAISKGVVAVITDKLPPLANAPDLVWVVARSIDQTLAGALAQRLFDYPGRKLKLLAVTGTNGKTTTCLIAAYLLNQAGLRCGTVGTVYVDDGSHKQPAQLTTPGAVELARLLARMVHNGCQAATLEASSHALDQGRLNIPDIDAAVFTNLTGDHLDYHKTMQQYAAVKAKLFNRLNSHAWAIINRDDAYASHMVQDCPAQLLHYAINPSPTPDQHCHAQITQLASDHSWARFNGPWGSFALRLAMVGRHNIANALGAIAAVHTIVPMTFQVCRSLEHMPPVPGRLQPVDAPSHDGPTVLVDYAHTHDALHNVLGALRPVTKGRLIVLFGCGGDRDTTKRSKMATVACQWADHVIVTSDNPRCEDPDVIITEILAGVPQKVHVEVEPDRAKAIRSAIRQASDDDIVLLAGKGHEPYQEIHHVRHPFDDRKQAVSALIERSRCTR